MTVTAVMRDGRELAVDPRLGATIPDVVASLTARTLTGSAAALEDAEVGIVGGEPVRYGDVNMLVEATGFTGG